MCDSPTDPGSRHDALGGCPICRACAELLPKGWLEDQGEHDENACALLHGEEIQVKSGSLDMLALTEWSPPPHGTPPFRLLSLAGDDENCFGGTAWASGAQLEQLGFRIWPAAKLLLEELAGVSRLGHVLEVGAGTGAVGLSLTWRGVADSVVLTDRDPVCVKLLRANVVISGAPHASALPLSLGDDPQGEFNTVVACEVLYDLEALERPSQLLATASAAVGKCHGHLYLGYQHRVSAVTEALFDEAARLDVAVQEVRSGVVPGGWLVNGAIPRISVYRFDFGSPFRSGCVADPKSSTRASRTGEVACAAVKKTKTSAGPRSLEHVRCKNFGCGKFFDSTKPQNSICVHHRKPPVFHEGAKYWSCCPNLRAWDWDEFMKIPGCSKGQCSTEEPAKKFMGGVDLRAQNAPKLLDDELPLEPRKKLDLLRGGLVSIGIDKTSFDKMWGRMAARHGDLGVVVGRLQQAFSAELKSMEFYRKDTSA